MGCLQAQNPFAVDIELNDKRQEFRLVNALRYPRRYREMVYSVHNC
jgi:hypothetical protein